MSASDHVRDDDDGIGLAHDDHALEVEDEK